MPVNLTANAISAINAGDVNSKPLVQVLDIKLIGSNQERYRFLISDSDSAQHAMLASQLNDRVKAGLVKKGSVVQLIEYICSAVQGRKIIVVLNMETIIPDCEIIGNPKLLSDSDPTAQRSSYPPSKVQRTTIADSDSSGMQNHVNKAPARGAGFQTPASNTPSFRPSVQPPYQPPPNYKNAGPIMKNEAPARIIPIAALNPYQGRWAIKVRVTAKGDLRRYNNARGDGKVFSFDLLDSDGYGCLSASIEIPEDVTNGVRRRAVCRFWVH